MHAALRRSLHPALNPLWQALSGCSTPSTLPFRVSHLFWLHHPINVPVMRTHLLLLQHVINFAFVPPSQRILYANVVSVAGTYLLSRVRGGLLPPKALRGGAARLAAPRLFSPRTVSCYDVFDAASAFCCSSGWPGLARPSACPPACAPIQGVGTSPPLPQPHFRPCPHPQPHVPPLTSQSLCCATCTPDLRFRPRPCPGACRQPPGTTAASRAAASSAAAPTGSPGATNPQRPCLMASTSSSTSEMHALHALASGRPLASVLDALGAPYWLLEEAPGAGPLHCCCWGPVQLPPQGGFGGPQSMPGPCPKKGLCANQLTNRGATSTTAVQQTTSPLHFCSPASALLSW